MAEGRITRGTTGTNRLRRIDRFIAALPALRQADRPIVVDLGFGANAWTAVELSDRLARVRDDVEVVGVEIDPARVEAARPFQRPRLQFLRGGFETPTPGGEPATVIRALNVLRQYEESEVVAAWKKMASRLQIGGVVIDGTCNEIGRVASWVTLGTDGPISFTIALRLTDLEKPSIVAERLPKILIHRNIAGERIHDFLNDLDRSWQLNSPRAPFGATQRFIATAQQLSDLGWAQPDASIPRGRSRWKLGEFSVPWAAVAPPGFAW